MGKQNYKFIKTQDKETKETLLSLGFQLISDDGCTATFINDSRARFGQIDKNKTAFSNKLEL